MREIILYLENELKTCIVEREGKPYDIALDKQFDNLNDWLNTFIGGNY